MTRTPESVLRDLERRLAAENSQAFAQPPVCLFRVAEYVLGQCLNARHHGSSVMEVGPGPGAIRIGHCFESNGTGGGRNGLVPSLALSATIAARASPPINS